jgi:two-component system LytT family response regulator
LEAALNPAQFARIHRSTIVNLDRVKELHPHFNGEHLVILHDGTELKLSRARKDWLEQWLGVGAG